MDDSSAFNQNGSEIAIIGLSGCFPGAKNIEEFWQNLQAGRETITFFTDEELIDSGIDPVLVDNPKYVKARGVLADAEFFDASFFGFTPREAEITDPQHRLFLECAWSALENSGYNPESYAGTIGVYAGSGLSGYLFNVYTNENIRNSVDFHQITIGGDKDYLSTRVSYKFNLQGPSYTVQTACSTSLVAVHLGCQSLLNGECDMALAGGVSISALRKHGYFYKEGGIGSPDGHCRAFDAKAQGTVGGEGVGVVVLKRLEDAIADRDTIYAVIKGSAINNDGSQKVSYTAPSIDTQAKVIKTAQAVAEVAPETITYIEAHGTGTSLGDPIEIAALTEAFRANTDKTGFCAIGSLKTNTGHLDAAAGVAGLIKTVLALKHQKIPASLHFEHPNPQIDFVNSPFYVNTQLTDWQTNGIPRRAGVSSFGIGGTNAHVILEEAPLQFKIQNTLTGRLAPTKFKSEYLLLCISAKTATALETATQNLASYLQQNQDLNLADVAYTLAVGRKALEHRRILVCHNLENAITTLTSLDSPEVFTHYQKPCHRPVVFMFPGQGSQYVNMGRELYETEPYFKEQIDYCAELLKPHLGFDLRDVIYPNATQTQELTQTAITQPALFVIEYALAKLWMNWGVRPEAMIGHSIGEYVAATLAGVFSLEDALKLVANRGRLMQQLPDGAMLSVQMGESEIQPFLGVELALAASNAPSSCVVSGSVSAIAKLEQQLQQQGINCRKLHTSGAFHSSMMDAMIEPFTKSLQQISLHPPQIPFISNLSGTWISAEAATDPDYWAKHLRQTVRFSDGITQLQKQPERLFLEVGPGKTLSTFVKHQKPEVVTLTSLRHPQEQKSDIAFIFNTLGRLWLQGVKIDWSSFYSHEKLYHIPLPTYPFERQRYWVEPQQQKIKTQITTDEIWKSVVEIGKKQAQTQLLERENYLSNKQCLDNLCLAYINLALQDLDIFKDAVTKYSFAEIYEQSQIISRYRQLLYRWLDVLVETGYLQQEQGLFSNLNPMSNDMVNALLDESRLKLANLPQLVDIVAECGANLTDVLRGKIEPLELYFAASKKRTENTKLEVPIDTYLKGIMRASLEQIVKLLPKNVNLRILEIGGGQGIATTALLPVLPKERTSYTFTDVGGLLLNKAQEKFSSYSFVEYRFLDIEKPPTEQGYTLHSFDVIIAVNVLHITHNLGKTLDYVRSLLAPEGLLLLWEITEAQLNFDITDGLLMNPLEDAQRSRGNPFLSQNQWCEALKAHGFIEVAAVSETEVFGEEILIAQATTTDSAPTAFSTFIDHKASTDNTTLVGKKPNIADWFYIPTWKRASLPQNLLNEIKTTQPKCYLVFVDECGLGEKIATRLRLEGGEVITVKVCENYTCQSDRSYTINPEQPQDYKFLCQELRNLGKTPAHIIHLWSVTPDHLEELTPQQYESLGFYSLVFLTQAIAEFYQKDNLHIQVISNHLQMVTGSEKLCPEKALIMGTCKVIPQEYANLTCSSIDVVLPTADSWQEKQLINQLITEISLQTPEQVIAYRGNHRWVQDFEAIKLDTSIQKNQRLRKNGVYLITGGLGGVGLVLAEYLAKTVQAKLILVGRSPFPQADEWTQWLTTHDAEDVISQKIQKLQNLQALGAEIMVISADVANYEEMSAVVQKTNLQFGQINGVIHAAAVLGGGMIQLKSKEIAAEALAPKVQGTRILNQIFQNTKLDFFVLCSSLSAFAGTSGMVDYTAENAFLDAFANYHAAQHSNFITSINWDRWQSVGMAVAVEQRHQEITGEELIAGMTVKEGVEAFHRILSSSHSPQIIVSTQDLFSQLQTNKSHKSIEEELAKLNQARATHPRPNLDNIYVAPRNEMEIALADIWQQLLGIDSVGIHDNFFELGGDSLFATQLVSQLCKTFQIELSYKNFFNSPTIAELAAMIVQNIAEQTDLEDLAQALADIENLSEQEVNNILAVQS